jgi:hypothetical protein
MPKPLSSGTCPREASHASQGAKILAIRDFDDPSQNGYVTDRENVPSPHRYWLVTDVTRGRLSAGQGRQTKMDNAIVERAVRALTEIGAVRPVAPESTGDVLEPVSRGTTGHKVPDKLQDQISSLAACGSLDCAGCYDVGGGRRIHPPKCGEEYRVWIERWEARGRMQ